MPFKEIDITIGVTGDAEVMRATISPPFFVMSAKTCGPTQFAT